MTAPKRDSLLPVDGTLDHNGRALHIRQRLSAGLTGEVYRGELALEESASIPVAVKVMKALEFPMARQLFLQESETLAFMMHLEREADQEQGISLKVAPHYYGRGEFNGTPYLVMEFVRGVDVPALIARHGKLPEAQALTIAWHLFRTLDVMHTRLRKSYIDLKFNNLWWVSGESGGSGQLKLLDFGTLEAIKPGDVRQRGVKRDILLGSVYLLAMLTGYTLDYSLGELRERAEPRVREAEVSWGTRQLLRRLLHRNSAVRPTSAAEVAAELWTQVHFWEEPAAALMEIAENNLAEAEAEPEGPEARDFAGRARAALDIARLRPPFDEDRLADGVTRAERILAISDYPARGRALLLGRSYTLARQTFEQGMQWSDEPGHLRRWAYLARLGEKVSPTTFEQHRDAAIEVVERLNAGRWQDAAERLASLAPALESPGLAYLRADCQLFDMLEQAEAARREEKFQEAADAYRLALEALAQLPDAGFVETEEVGKLLDLAQEMGRLAETRGKAEALMVQAEEEVKAGAFDRARDGAAEAFRLDWENPQWWAQLGALVELGLKAHAYAPAVQLGEIGLKYPRRDDALLSRVSLAARLTAAEHALADRDREAFLAAVNGAVVEFASHPVTRPAARRLLDRAEERAIAANEAAFLEALAEARERLDDNERGGELRRSAKQIRDQMGGRLRETADRLLASAVELLALDDPTRLSEVARGRAMADLLELLRGTGGRLSQVDTMVADAEALVGRDPAYQDRIAKLRARITAEQAALQTRIESVDEAERNRRRSRLTAEWDDGRAFRDWAGQAEAVGALPDVRERIGRQLAHTLQDFIYKCYAYFAEVDASDAVVRGLFDQASAQLDRLGALGWQPLQQAAAERNDRARAELTEARQAFEAGDSARAAAKLTMIAPQAGSAPEWLSLKVKVISAEAFRAWQTAHALALEAGSPDPALLRALSGYLDLNLPAPYYLQAHAYLKQAWQNARAAAHEAMASPDSVGFLDSVKAWLGVELAARRVGFVISRPRSRRSR